MTAATHGGGCLCGAVRFSFEGPPLWTGYCHCFSCRRNTGAPVAMFVGVAAPGFRCQGPVAQFSSTPGVQRGYCTACGTPLTYAARQFPGEVHIYCSALDEPDLFPPQFHVHYAERVSWFALADSLPRYLATSDGPLHHDN